MSNVFGIDLGTTYSCVAQLDENGRPETVENFDRSRTTPSVVHFLTENNYDVGEDALRQMPRRPEMTVRCVKRSMGDDAAFVKPNQFPFDLDPSEISALILKYIVQAANDKRDEDGLDPIKDVVITCPAYFNHTQRMRTKQAGEMAGLNVLGVINEPVAAALSYGMKLQEEKTLLVYDLGGGTFDISVIKTGSSQVVTVVTGGDDHLGGMDWDEKVARYFLEKFNEESQTSYTMQSKDSNGEMLGATLLLVAEKSKRELTRKPSTMVFISYDGRPCQFEFTRDEFDSLTYSLLKRTEMFLDSVMEEAEEKVHGIAYDEVLLVGGSSRMPQVKAMLQKKFSCPVVLKDPDEAVAKGAVIYADFKMKHSDDIVHGLDDTLALPEKIVCVSSKTYGFGCVDHETEKLIVKNAVYSNAALPAECANLTLYTKSDNQTSVYISVFESDSMEEYVDQVDATELDGHSLEFDGPKKKGTPIRHCMKIDENGIMSVHAELEENARYCIDFELQIKGVKNKAELEQSKQLVSSFKFD